MYSLIYFSLQLSEAKEWPRNDIEYAQNDCSKIHDLLGKQTNFLLVNYSYTFGLLTTKEEQYSSILNANWWVILKAEVFLIVMED